MWCVAGCASKACPDLMSAVRAEPFTGGWHGTLPDSAMTCAVPDDAFEGRRVHDTGIQGEHHAGIPPETPVTAEGVVQRAGQRTGVASGSIVGKDDGRFYATGSTTCIAIPLG